MENSLNWATPIGRNAKGRFTSLRNNVIVISNAIYGNGDLSAVVTDRLQNAIGKKITNRLTGIDPCPRIKKELTVQAMVNGLPVSRTFAEGEIFQF